jgi:ABC-2 type transport system permease protein
MKAKARRPKAEGRSGERLTSDNAAAVLARDPSRLLNLARYLRIYAELWKNSVVREMSFKVSFLLWIVVELLWFVLQLTFIGVLYLHTDHIGTCTKWQVVMLIGASNFMQQIYTAIFLSN